MSKTTLKSYSVGTAQTGKHGGGELRVFVEGEDWRAVGGLTIEAPTERGVEDVANKIINALSEAGHVDPLNEPAMCPDCGCIFKGSREPGDTDTCRESGREVELIEPPEEMLENRDD